MSVPNEIWYAVGGLIVAWLAQRLKLPWPSGPKGDDLRTILREILMDVLRQPAPVAAKAMDDDEFRRRVQEIVRDNGK